ncbi:DUF2399 domain-containing protein [Lactiplantibacillus sp. WILCCON 0030]|uniref:DUF2399 domain-containing protein n=1 Tax=Lactiplantibacillus brownii TaxID=3069269 RepID=A0ABU1A520_9LACO|nr:DUF2399 domain-containing protein [Lactiplantibacillus brownii]MDQ7936092.1 DUF2399 domain-containing protein [Lactiplantibacillus brownii]
MNPYRKQYEAQTGKVVSKHAQRLEPLFTKISTGATLPPRGQQAVDLGFTAHSLNDPREDPEVYQYYQWVLANFFEDQVVHELSAKLIGATFTAANIFKTDLPQPITLNPWQIEKMMAFPLATKRAIIVENNGVFIWLLHRHPDWPMINQAGNDFNQAYLEVVQSLEQRQVALTYIGDIDSRGIQMADYLFGQLSATTIETFTAIQSPTTVFQWLTTFGKPNVKRSRDLRVIQPTFRKELDSINVLKCFVEQEQLISTYEALIPAWLQSC